MIVILLSILVFAQEVSADVSQVIRSKTPASFQESIKEVELDQALDRNCRPPSNFMALIGCLGEVQKRYSNPSKKRDKFVRDLMRFCPQISFEREFVLSADEYLINDGLELIATFEPWCGKNLRSKWELSLYKWK